MMVSTMSSAEYKVARQTGSTANYARVRVTVAEGPDQVVVAPTAGDWLKEEHPGSPGLLPEDLRQGAIDGVRHALRNLTRPRNPLSVSVDQIHFTVVDTRPTDVAFAACHAIWRALGDPGLNPPLLAEAPFANPRPR